MANSSVEKKYNHIGITRNMLSTDLITPGRRNRETLPAIGYVQSFIRVFLTNIHNQALEVFNQLSTSG